jgi:hypothetical protein
MSVPDAGDGFSISLWAGGEYVRFLNVDPSLVCIENRLIAAGIDVAAVAEAVRSGEPVRSSDIVGMIEKSDVVDGLGHDDYLQHDPTKRVTKRRKS